MYPETQEQRCWVHKIANVLDKHAKRLQPGATDMPHEIMRPPGRQDVLDDMTRPSGEFQARHPKAVETLTND